LQLNILDAIKAKEPYYNAQGELLPWEELEAKKQQFYATHVSHKITEEEWNTKRNELEAQARRGV